MENAPTPYFIERLDHGFNLWEQVAGRYYNLATLFYNDPFCGTQWTTTPREKSVVHQSSDIEDELESPLQAISRKHAESLLAAQDPEAARKSLEELI